MKKGRLSRIVILVILSLTIVVTLGFRASSREGAGRQEIVEEMKSGDRQDRVKHIKTIKPYGKSLDWSPANNLIASARRGSDGYFDVFIMKPDGSDERCLTSGRAGCPQKHNGNPAWHPSGDYIVFTAEKSDNPAAFKKWAIPGTGLNCDLWVMTRDGREFFQLTDYPGRRPFRAVIHPQFSHDGKRLFWAERVEGGEPSGGGGPSGGGWVLKVANYVDDGEVCRLDNIRTYRPGKQRCFYESHAFSNDDEKILFCGNLESGQNFVGMDIYELDLGTNGLENLTGTPSDWDEHAHYSPDGTKIAWMSSTGLDIEWGDTWGHNWKRYLKAELWIMDADGSNKRRLTFFNEPGHPEYMGGRRCVVADSTWSPDGKTIAALVAYETGGGRLAGKIVMIDLEEEAKEQDTS